MPDKEKIAIFDFCETIVPFQSASAFVGYVARRHASLKHRFRWIIFKVLRRTRITSKLESLSKGKTSEKLLSLWVIKGLSYDKLDDASHSFYENVLRPAFIPEVIHELERRKADGYRIVLASGGYGIYLRYFAKEFGIAEQDMLSSNLEFINQTFSGRMTGLDCMRTNKLVLIEQLFNRDNTYCVAYSDSESDIPILTWADEGFVVKKSPSWISQNKLPVFSWAG